MSSKNAAKSAHEPATPRPSRRERKIMARAATAVACADVDRLQQELSALERRNQREHDRMRRKEHKDIAKVEMAIKDDLNPTDAVAGATASSTTTRHERLVSNQQASARYAAGAKAKGEKLSFTNLPGAGAGSEVPVELVKSAACLLQPDKYLAYDTARALPHGFGGAACSSFALKVRGPIAIPAAVIPVDPPGTPTEVVLATFPTNAIAVISIPTISPDDNTVTSAPAIFSWTIGMRLWQWNPGSMTWTLQPGPVLIPAIVNDGTDFNYTGQWTAYEPTVNSYLLSVLGNSKTQMRMNGGYLRFTFPVTTTTGFTANTVVSQCGDSSVFNFTDQNYESFSYFEAAGLQSAVWNTTTEANGCTIRYIGQTSSEQEFYEVPTLVGVATSDIVVGSSASARERRELSRIFRAMAAMQDPRPLPRPDLRDVANQTYVDDLITKFEKTTTFSRCRVAHTVKVPKVTLPGTPLNPAVQSYASPGETFTLTVLTSAESTSALPLTVEGVFAIEYIGSTALCLEEYEPNSPGAFQNLQASSLTSPFLVGPHSFADFFKNLWGGVKKAAGWVAQHLGDIAKVAEVALPLIA